MRLACPYQLSPTQNLIGNGMMASAKNGGYLPSDNPASLVAWFRTGVGVTSSGGFASAWADQSGNGNDLLQATGTNQPAYSAGILTFDGVDNYMKCVAFTFNQPEQISMLLKQVTWSSLEYFTDGNIGDQMDILQYSVTPDLQIYAGTGPVAANSNAALGAYFALTVMINGASSSILVNNTTATTGNAGSRNGAGFTLGARGSNNSGFCNFEVKEIILRNVDDATIRADDHAYLMALGGI